MILSATKANCSCCGRLKEISNMDFNGYDNEKEIVYICSNECNSFFYCNEVAI